MTPTPIRPSVMRSSTALVLLPITVFAAVCGTWLIVVAPERDVFSTIVALVLGVASAVCTGYLLQRSVRRVLDEPLNRIIEITNAIADGAIHGRISLNKDALLETVRVADAINRLAHRSAKDINEMQRLERVRSEFVANVSHELRTPIFSVQGYLETLLDGAIDDESVARQFLDKAYNNALRLNALLSDLIDISRIESGELKFSFRYFSFRELVNDVLQASEMRAAQRNVTVENMVASDTQVYGDKERLVQVMTNLVENALKYNVDGGSVTISTTAVDGGLRIVVSDTGLGIPEEHLPRIFERFYRVDKDRSRAVGGTGLGLAIVKHILEAHSAPITVTSVVGKGTEISFVLKN